MGTTGHCRNPVFVHGPFLWTLHVIFVNVLYWIGVLMN